MSERRAYLDWEAASPGHPLVQMGDVLVWPGGNFIVEGGTDEPDLRISVRIEDGEPFLQEVRLVARDASTQITDADIAILARQKVENWIKWIMGNSSGYTIRGDGTPGLRIDASTSQAYTEMRAAAARGRRRGAQARLGDRHEEVARVYRAGDRRGAEAVAKHFGIQTRTAQLWVKQARDADHLGKALKGKAGEA